MKYKVKGLIYADISTVRAAQKGSLRLSLADWLALGSPTDDDLIVGCPIAGDRPFVGEIVCLECPQVTLEEALEDITEIDESVRAWREEHTH